MNSTFVATHARPLPHEGKYAWWNYPPSGNEDRQALQLAVGRLPSSLFSLIEPDERLCQVEYDTEAEALDALAAALGRFDERAWAKPLPFPPATCLCCGAAWFGGAASPTDRFIDVRSRVFYACGAKLVVMRDLRPGTIEQGWVFRLSDCYGVSPQGETNG